MISTSRSLRPFHKMGNEVKGHLYFIFSIIFESALVHPVSQNALKSWWQQPLEKTWALQCQNGAMAHTYRKTKNFKQHALFTWPVKIDVSNKQLVPPLNWKNPFSKTYWWLYIHSFNILFLYTILIVIPNKYLFKEMFLEIYWFFKKNGITDILQLANVYVKNWYILLK